MDTVIRKWHPEDKAALAGLLNNKRILDNLRDGIPYPYTERDAEAYIRSARSADADRNFFFAIEAGGRLVGSVGIVRRDNIHCRTAELGYYVGEAFWGRGCATEAVRQACTRVFQETDIVRIFAEPFAHNLASCRVLEKAGFQCEGILRSNAFKNGRLLDMKLYALIMAPALSLRRLS